MPTAGSTTEDLISAAINHYKRRSWIASSNFSQQEENLATLLSLRPEAIAKREGMVHLLHPVGKVKDVTFKHFKQVLYDIEKACEFCHVVLICEERVSQANEKDLKNMGLGVLLIRRDGDPLQLIGPKLCCFREPSSYDRVPTRIRQAVKRAIRNIAEEDVCVGVLDLAQILEQQLQRRLSGAGGTPLGALITQARANNLLNNLAETAARRVNVPRIRRAHAAGHAVRRRDIVMRAQEIVDDCLAVLFALG